MPDAALPLHVEIQNERENESVLLLHGGGVAGWMWHPFAQAIGSKRRLIIPDLPGHDYSSGAEYRSHEEAVARLADLVSAEADAPVSVVGFSLGAQLATKLASDRPDLVRDVVAVSAQAKPAPFTAATLALLRLAAPLAKNEKFARLQAKELFMPESLMSSYLRTSKGLTRNTLTASVGENMRFTVPDGWRSFPGRSLVLVGANERSLMRSSAELLADVHVRSEIEVVAECGHGIPLQRPEWLAQRLDAWLA